MQTGIYFRSVNKATCSWKCEPTLYPFYDILTMSYELERIDKQNLAVEQIQLLRARNLANYRHTQKKVGNISHKTQKEAYFLG